CRRWRRRLLCPAHASAPPHCCVAGQRRPEDPRRGAAFRPPFRSGHDGDLHEGPQAAAPAGGKGAGLSLTKEAPSQPVGQEGAFVSREEVTGVPLGQPRLYERLSAVSSSQFWAKLRTATKPAAAADESRPMSARSGSAGAATRPAK